MTPPDEMADRGDALHAAAFDYSQPMGVTDRAYHEFQQWLVDQWPDVVALLRRLATAEAEVEALRAQWAKCRNCDVRILDPDSDHVEYVLVPGVIWEAIDGERLAAQSPAADEPTGDAR